MPTFFGIDLVQQLWAGLAPLVLYLLLIRHRERVQELLKKALIVYLLAWFTYEVVRAVALPQARDSWLVLGMKTFLVFVLLELTWEKIHPPAGEEVPSSLTRALYIILGLAGFIGVVLSFLGRA